MILQQFITDAQIKLVLKYGEREANAILNNLLFHVFKYSKADLLYHGADDINTENKQESNPDLTKDINN